MFLGLKNFFNPFDLSDQCIISPHNIVPQIAHLDQENKKNDEQLQKL